MKRTFYLLLTMSGLLTLIYLLSIWFDRNYAPQYGLSSEAVAQWTMGTAGFVCLVFALCVAWIQYKSRDTQPVSMRHKAWIAASALVTIVGLVCLQFAVHTVATIVCLACLCMASALCHIWLIYKYGRCKKSICWALALTWMLIVALSTYNAVSLGQCLS